MRARLVMAPLASLLVVLASGFLGFRRGHWNNHFDTHLLRGAERVDTKGYINDALSPSRPSTTPGDGSWT